MRCSSAAARYFSLVVCGDARSRASYDDVLGVGVRVNAVICDPPYLLLERRRLRGDLRDPRLGRKIDDEVVVRFRDEAHYVAFSREWLSQTTPRIQEGGTMCIWTNNLGRAPLLSVCGEFGWTLYDQLAWAKDSSAKDRAAASTAEQRLRVYESALILRKRNNSAVPDSAAAPVLRLRGLAAVTSYADTTGHVHEKPRSAIEPLVLLYTRPGDTVLDPFAGSGSILATAAALGREPRGIEIREEWALDADARLVSSL
jgi:site-specific DNA-methyltransferase (adenine-specific)